MDGDEGEAAPLHWGAAGEGDDYDAAPDDFNPEDEDGDELGDLPEFANQENRELHAEVMSKERRINEVDKLVDEHAQRVAVMAEHLKNVQQELQHTQQLTDAKNKEIETEDHLKQLAERQAGRVRQDLQKLDIRAEEIQDQLNVCQNHIFKGNEQMDRFKLQMNWNQEELEQWALAAKQKEEDNMALEKYTRADEAKIKELTLQVEKVTQQVTEKKAELDQEVTETQAKQIELDKTAEEFRTLHRERQQLVRQWQEAIEAMRRRDEEIERASEQFAAAKDRLAAKQEELKEYADRLKAQQMENGDFESKIAMKERIVARQREQFQFASEKLQEFKDEVEVLKNELQKAASDLMQRRSENVNLNTELEVKRQALEASRSRFHAVKKQLENAQKSTDDVEQVCQVREAELKDKEAELEAAEKDLRILKESMFKQSQELFRLRQRESNLIAEIAGAQAAGKNLSAKINLLDQESLRQQELVYKAEFQIQQLERKVARASGERSGEERKVLNAKIAALQAELEAEQAQVATLAQQVKRLEDDLRATNRQRQALTKELQRVQAKMDEMNLQNESAEVSLKGTLKEKEAVMVEHDVLKLEVKKLREALSAKNDDVYGLSNRKFQLEMSMEERKKEIEVHSEMQRGQCKVAEEERHRIAMELQERLQKVAKLKAKYEMLAKKTSGQDSDGEEKSQAYFVIKAAQRREELQRRGDELDAAIRKSEREIRALEHTLKSLNVRNIDYRGSFHKADMSSREALQVKNLEEQVKSANDVLFRKKKELQRMQTDLEEDNRRIAQLDDQAAQMVDHVEHLTSAKGQVEREEMAQREEIEAARIRVAQLSAKHREAVGAGEETLDEKAFQAQVRACVCVWLWLWLWLWLSVGGGVCVDWLSPSLGPRHRPSATPTTTCCSRWASSRVSSRSSSRPCKPRSRTTASRFRHAHRLGLWAAHLGVVALARGLGGLAVPAATTACRNSSSRWAFRRAHTPISHQNETKEGILWCFLQHARTHTTGHALWSLHQREMHCRQANPCGHQQLSQRRSSGQLGRVAQRPEHVKRAMFQHKL